MMKPHTKRLITAIALVVLGAASTRPAAAQKLVNAPSAVMLAKNIQQQNTDAGTPRSAASALASAEVAPDKTLDTNLNTGPAASVPEQLTLREAEQIAIRNNPHVHVGQLLARAQHQVYRETRSAYLPQVEGGAIGAKADSGSRFTFDGLRSTRLLTHAGGGVTVNQMIFDFGRTANLIAASKLREKAQDANALAGRMDVVLITDQAFYSALEAQALVRLAQQTVDTRNATNQQISELTANKLRSNIDLAFSEENVAQANLLLLDARTRYDKSINALTAVMGFDRPMQYRLLEDATVVPLPPPDEDSLVLMALKQRPDLKALDNDRQAAKKYSRAKREQLLPTIGATGVVGLTPVRTDAYFDSNWFGAVGVTLRVPIFNGFLYSAQAAEAGERARVAQENLYDLRNRVVRDVRDAWLETNSSYQKMDVTKKYLRAANMGLNLAQARYNLGLSSIVELSQAQLTQTQASMENVNARFEYKVALAVLNYRLGTLP